jgi:hypothetical protein
MNEAREIVRESAMVTLAFAGSWSVALSRESSRRSADHDEVGVGSRLVTNLITSIIVVYFSCIQADQLRAFASPASVTACELIIFLPCSMMASRASISLCASPIEGA